MLSKKSFGIAGAAMLGSVALMGTNAANAAIDLDAEDKSEAAVIFALETVTDMVPEDGMYYKVTAATTGGDDGSLDIEGKIGVGVVQDGTLIITFDLTGMVFGNKLSASSLTFQAPDGQDALQDRGPWDGCSNPEHRRRQLGTCRLCITFLPRNAAMPKEAVATLAVDMAGVSMSGGSVEMTVRNALDDSMHDEDYMGAVQVASAVSIKTSDPMMNAKTYVATDYEDFGPMDPNVTSRMYMADLGYFQLSVMNLNAVDGDPVNFEDVFGTDAVSATRDDALEEASIMIDGSLDFGHKDVFLVARDDNPAEGVSQCATATRVDLYVPNTETEDDMDDMMLVGATLNEIGATDSNDMTNMMHLCIEVPGAAMDDTKIRIPRTDNYMAMLMAEGTEAAKAGKPISASGTLGKIERDGTIVHLPYLTTSGKYKQRLVIVNRNKDRVAYTIEYTDEEGNTSTPRPGQAGGFVSGDQATSMKVADMVEIIGTKGSRTSATLTLESIPEMIDVATTLINVMEGTTDTVVYEPEE